MGNNKYVLGLDLGITSVGYGIIDQNNNIITYGTRLFDESDASNNVGRRQTRGSRRLKSRKRNRIIAIKCLLLRYGIIDSFTFPNVSNVYELRCKGLDSKLTNLELANVLVNIAKRRGSSLEIVIDENDKELGETYASLTNNTKELQKRDIYVCQLQLERMNNGKLRDHTNIFRTEDYQKELEKILSNQELEQTLKDKIIEIVIRRRSFSEGPGSENFPTKYGSYRLESVDGKLVINHVNLIDVMRGKCSIFKDEPRIAKNTYEACLFNLLNDLNNITYIENDQKNKLSEEQKRYIIKNFINKKGSITIKELFKYLNVSDEDVSGFRIDSKGKKLLSEFPIFQKILKLNLNLDYEQIDLIIDILTKTLVLEERYNEIKNLGYMLTDEQINDLSKLSKVNGYHSLSKKAMDILIPELISSSKNQMEIIQDSNLGRELSQYKGLKDIPFDNTLILSPVAKRVHAQAIKITNALRKKYGEFDSIIIETTRAKNSEDEKDIIKKTQAYHETSKKVTNEMLINLGKNPDDFNTLTKLKIRLYNEQLGKTMYDQETIDLDLLLNDPTAYEIEHIIPYAVSFDNSLNNKCIVSKDENQNKNKRTPFQYFTSGLAKGKCKDFESFAIFVNSLHISKKKKENLLNQNDVSKFENMEEFKARNLVDTSYGIRSVMNTMQKYFKENEISTKVRTVKGKFTDTFRKKADCPKNRDNYIHHAVDALIIASLANQKLLSQVLKLGKEEKIDRIDLNLDPLEDRSLLKFVSNLKNIKVTPFTVTHKIDSKTNRQFSDQTIYSTRIYDEQEYVIAKYKDIYGPNGIRLAKLFKDNKSTSLLMYRNDINTYNELKLIYQTYSNEKNPFAKYKEEHGFIRKYSKNGNGPIIMDVKYQDTKLGNHVDISHKYLPSKDRKVVLLSLKPYRTDIYKAKDGGYKMLTIKFNDIKQINGKNVIDNELYESMKKVKKITNDDEFAFSLYRNSIIKYQSANMNEAMFYRFVATNADTYNIIELKLISSATTDRIKQYVSKNTKVLEKYNVSCIGEYKKVLKEDLKLVW